MQNKGAIFKEERRELKFNNETFLIIYKSNI